MKVGLTEQRAINYNVVGRAYDPHGRICLLRGSLQFPTAHLSCVHRICNINFSACLKCVNVCRAVREVTVTTNVANNRTSKRYRRPREGGRTSIERAVVVVVVVVVRLRSGPAGIFGVTRSTS